MICTKNILINLQKKLVRKLRTVRTNCHVSNFLVVFSTKREKITIITCDLSPIDEKMKVFISLTYNVFLYHPKKANEMIQQFLINALSQARSELHAVVSAAVMQSIPMHLDPKVFAFVQLVTKAITDVCKLFSWNHMEDFSIFFKYGEVAKAFEMNNCLRNSKNQFYQQKFQIPTK